MDIVIVPTVERGCVRTMFKERFILTLSRETTLDVIDEHCVEIPVDYKVFAKEFLVSREDIYRSDTSNKAFNEYITEEFKKAAEGLAERIL